MEPIKFDLINPTSPIWRVHEGENPRGSRFFRFSMLSSLSVAAAMPPYVKTRITDEEIEPINFNTDADLIGISFMTYNAPRAYEIADKFRREKGKKVIFGGFHPTFMPEEAIQHADAICVVDDGRIVEQGRHEDLLASGGRYKDLYERQFAAVRSAEH